MAHATIEDVIKAFPVIDEVYSTRELHSALGYLSPVQSEGSLRPSTCQTLCLSETTARGALQMEWLEAI